MVRKTMSKIIRIFCVTIMVASLVACGQTQDSPSGQATSSDTSSNTPATTEAKTELKIRIPDGFASLDPHNFTLLTEYQICSQIYEPLYRLDSDNQEVPVLADSYTVSDDYLSATFHIKDGITFSNGDPLTASDVKYSIERAASSAYLSGNISTVTSVDADDANSEVVIHLSAPTPALIENISWVYIVDQSFVEANQDDNKLLGFNVCGTGPYTLDTYALDTSLSLKTNEAYRDEQAPIEKLVYYVITDNTTAANALRTGDLDVAQVSSVEYNALAEESNIETGKATTNNSTFVVFNTTVAPFDNVLVRQAIASAINRDDIVTMALDGMGTPMYTFAMPLMVSYSDIDPQFPYDPDKAVELLKEAGYEDGLDLGTVYTTAGGGILSIVQQQLAQVGITCNLEELEVNTLLSNLTTGSFGMSYMSMTNTYDMSYLANFFHSRNIGNYNLAQYTNPEVDDLLDQAASCMDPDERTSLYKTFLETVDTDTPYVNLFNADSCYAWNADLDYTPNTKVVLFDTVAWQ